MRSWAYWRLNALVEFLDDNVYRLRALVDRVQPPFVPKPLPEPHYNNHTEQCTDCGGYLAVPVQSDWSEATRDRWIAAAKHVHAMRCAAG